MDMTEREPGQDPTAEPQGSARSADTGAATNGGQPTGTDSEEAAVRRPSPGPSPTSRARRAAAASVGARRPSPRPTPAASNGSSPNSGPASAATNSAVTADSPATPASSRRASALTEERPAGDAEPADRAPAARRGRSPRWLAIVLGVLVLAGAAALVVAVRLPSGAGSVGERDQALSAAKTETSLILSYSYTSFDADVAKAKAVLTGRAASDYATAMDKTIKPTAVKVKAVVQAQTDGAGVESVSPDGRQVTVVVFGEQKVTNSSLSAPRTDLFRVRATLDLVSGHWLVSKFDQI